MQREAEEPGFVGRLPGDTRSRAKDTMNGPINEIHHRR